jgi:hypothetical protein
VFGRCITLALGTPSAEGPGAVFAGFWVGPLDQFGTSELVALYTDDGGRRGR